MANYSFTLKSSRVYSHNVCAGMKMRGQTVHRVNATRAASHVEYINREGKYAALDADGDLHRNFTSFVNTISGDAASVDFALPRKPLLLYDSPFGRIQLDNKGIHVTKNASTETVAIALSVAKRIYGNVLSPYGHEDFREKILQACQDFSLDVSFPRTDMETRRVALMKEREDIERRYNEQRNNRASDDRRSASPIPLSRPRGTTILQTADEGVRLHVLPGSSMDRKRRSAPMLLQDPVSGRLPNGRSGAPRTRDAYLGLRWSLSNGRAKSVEQTADAILTVIGRDEEKVSATAHVQYINREAAFAMRGGCVDKGHHLPTWAEDSPKQFFRQADTWERMDGEVYKEIVFALPNELSHEANREILDTFIERHLKDFYYTWAVHEKVGALSKNERHPHVHLMFSTRELDEYEKTVGRKDAESFFKRANTKHPKRGGCKKAEKWIGKERFQYLMEIREDFARIQNEVLEKHGVQTRVDHRTLEAQRADALAKGNTVLAEILDRVAESKHAVNKREIIEGSPRVRELKALRAKNDRHRKGTIEKALSSDASKELYIRRRLGAIEDDFRDITQKKEIQSLPEDAAAPLLQRVQEIHQQRRDIFALQQSIIWGIDAKEKAQLDFMDEESRALWEEMKHNRDLFRELKEYHQLELMKSDEEIAALDAEAQEDYLAEKLNTEAEMEMAYANYTTVAYELQPILKELSNRDRRKAIDYRTSEVLFEYQLPKQRLQKRIEDYADAVKELQRSIDLAKSGDRFEERAYTLEELRVVLDKEWQRCFEVSTEKKMELEQAMKEVISPARAEAIAKDVFTNHAYKALRQDESALKKEEASYEKEEALFARDAKAFNALPPLSFFEKARKGTAWKERDDLYNALQKRQSTLREQKKMLQERRDAYEERRRVLDARCASDEGRRKIAEIASGILRKNQPAVDRVTALKKEVEETGAALGAMQKDRASMQAASTKLGANTKVRVKAGAGGSTPLSRARFVAAAMRQPEYAALVAVSRPSKMDDDWKLLSEMEKEERIVEMYR